MYNLRIKLDRGQLGTGFVETGALLNVPRNSNPNSKHLLKKLMELEASVTTKIDMDPCLISVNFGLIFCNLYGTHIKFRHINS